MGKTYSKSEEIIIAQNGANSANFSEIETHMKLYGALSIVIVVLLTGLIMYYCCGACRTRTRGWLRKEMDNTVQQIQNSQAQLAV